MNVQIYILEDNKQLIYDNDQLTEFNNLVEELGLKCHNVRDNTKSPIPFMQLDEATIRAFKILTPRVDKLQNYQFEVPIEALRQVKLSETEKYFDTFEVWSNQKDPDPFLIGRVYKNEIDREKNYTWNQSTYLIARWGAENKSVSELMQMAVDVAAERIKNHAEAAIAKMTSWKACPEIWARQFISGGNNEASSAIDNQGLAF